MKKKIIVTVGPSIMDKHGIKAFVELGDFIYRINGAHGSIAFISNYVDRIRQSFPEAKILIDMPGNKIRLNNIERPITFKYGDKINLSRNNFNCSEFFPAVESDMRFSTNDGQDSFVVKYCDGDNIRFKSLSDGVLINNKGFTASGLNKSLPFLFEKDKQLLELMRLKSIDYAGLSFVRSLEDILSAEKISPSQKFMVKVETKAAIKDLDRILSHSDFIIIDRGDLSLDVGYEYVPYYIDYILKCKKKHNKIFIATQFLKFMETHPAPLLSEVNDLYNAFKKNIEGIQLSEETAIGHFPIECLKLIGKIMDSIYSQEKKDKLNVICNLN